MDNLINNFMNYKISYLTKCSLLVFNKDTKFIRNCLDEYFRIYIDCYYYGIFHTVDSEECSFDTLKLEFQGIMVEMLEDYKEYELQVSNEEYAENTRIIKNMKDLALEIIKLDQLNFKEKSEISGVVLEFINSNDFINNYIGSRTNELINLVKHNFVIINKILNFSNNYFIIRSFNFKKNRHFIFLDLDYQIKALNVYRKTLSRRVYSDKKLELKKLECLIQKISIFILQSIVNKNAISKMFIYIDDSFLGNGKLNRKILQLLDNPLIRKYVVLCVNYNAYLSHRGDLYEDFELACIQDFTHINDIYTKTDTIYKEGIFNYLIVKACKYKDIEYFLEYEADGMVVLVFEEE